MSQVITFLIRNFCECLLLQQKNRIEIKLDIAAPKIIVPESFFDQNTTMVVFDLGYLSFQNAQPGNFNQISPDSEDQDGK